MAEKQFTIISQEGLHARPAAALVGEANRFQSEQTLEFNSKRTNLKSILGVMALGIPTGSVITISAQGADAESAISGAEELLKANGMIQP